MSPAARPARASIAALPLLVLALFATPTGSTTVVHLDTPALVRSSSDIVVGTVEATRTRWNESRTQIVTEVDVQVTESLKGANGRITLVQLGGELDGMRYSVPGMPSFRGGEEALLFVWRDARGRAQVNGLAQGKFEIQRDPETRTATVRRNLEGLELRDTRPLDATRPERASAAVPLSRMLGEIRQILEEDGR